MLTGRKAVLFDFDGTLAHLNVDFQAMRRAVRRLAEQYGLAADALDGLFVLEMIEQSRAMIEKISSGGGRRFVGRAMDLIRDIEVEAALRGRLFPGIEEMMAALFSRGIKIGIVTRNCEEAVRLIYPAVDQFCGVLVSREYTKRVKPHPDHLLVALDILETAAHESVMVGDHPMDIVAGKEAGACTVGVLTGFADHDMLAGANPDIILDRATEILHVIN
ncbi:MAG: HAD family hydrolase [Deltaproteobacteria bacterium]|nr:HAD family hydrolase [Deltaproteobacteria bacterium]